MRNFFAGLIAALLAGSATAQTLPNVPPPPGSSPPTPTIATPTAAPRAPVTQAVPLTQAAPLAPTAIANDWVAGSAIDLRVLDKVTARASTLTGKVGETLIFGSLSIEVRACALRPPDKATDFMAFLDISDRAGLAGFHGWMLASSPALAMLEHPSYDVKVLACRP